MHLQVENIIVCGHTHCGACEALIGQANHKKLLRATERFNVIEQLNHLLTYPAVKHKVHAGEVHIMGWFYHVESGNLDYFNPVEYRFVPLEHIDKKPRVKSNQKV